MKGLIWLVASVLAVYTHSALANNCEVARDLIMQAEQVDNTERKLQMLQKSAKECPAADIYITLASNYLNNQQPSPALKWLLKAEPFINTDNNMIFGAWHTLKAEAYVQKNMLCKANRNLLKAKKSLGNTHPLIKEVDLAFEFKRTQQILDEKTLTCLLSATRSMSTRGVGIRPSINITVPFATGSELPTQRGASQVQALAKVLANEDYVKYKFVIVGHADSRGEASYNLALSEKRAEQVLKQINHVAPLLSGRLSFKGMGEMDLKVVGNDAKSHAVNRRVEVVMVRI